MLYLLFKQELVNRWPEVDSSLSYIVEGVLLRYNVLN